MSNYFEELEKQKLKLGKEIKERIAENEMLYNFKDDVPLNNNKDGMATLMGEIVDRENLTIDEKDRLRRETDIAQLYSNFGDDLTKFLNDDSIIEIYLNQDGFLRIEKFGTGRILTNIRFSPKRAENILKLVASFNSTVITTEQPFISAVLPKGERITGIISNPVGHNPIFTIRKKSNIRFELSYYVKQGVIEEWQKEYLEEKIRNKKNILIAGNTSSGKTTFGNACVEYLERMEKEDLEFLKEYSNINNLNMSSFVRNLILDKIYDEITEEDEKRILKRWEKSKSEKTSDAEDVFKRLGL